MGFTVTIGGTCFELSGLRELLAKANEEKFGEQLAGRAAKSEREPLAAEFALALLLSRTFFGKSLGSPMAPRTACGWPRARYLFPRSPELAAAPEDEESLP